MQTYQACNDDTTSGFTEICGHPPNLRKPHMWITNYNALELVVVDLRKLNVLIQVTNLLPRAAIWAESGNLGVDCTGTSRNESSRSPNQRRSKMCQ